MSTREQVVKLSQKGLGPTEIASNLGISRQRVHQILKSPERKQRGRKPHMDAQKESALRTILGTRDSWTWLEAETELSKHDVKAPAMKIYDYLRELGFKKTSRNSARWIKA